MTIINRGKYNVSVFFGLLFFLVFLAIILQVTGRNFSLSHETILSELQYPADFSDDKLLVGAAHNIFIGKVIKQINTKDLGIGPETQFEVEVVDNIKGNIEGKVVVNQLGGYKNGDLYITEDALFTEDSEEPSLLQIGSTYLFSTRYNEQEEWHTLIAYPTANKLLSSSESSLEQLKTPVTSDSRVQRLREIYPNEILLEADVRSDNALNSFASVAKEEKVSETDKEIDGFNVSKPIIDSASSSGQTIDVTDVASTTPTNEENSEVE